MDSGGPTRRFRPAPTKAGFRDPQKTQENTAFAVFPFPLGAVGVFSAERSGFAGIPLKYDIVQERGDGPKGRPRSDVLSGRDLPGSKPLLAKAGSFGQSRLFWPKEAGFSRRCKPALSWPEGSRLSRRKPASFPWRPKGTRSRRKPAFLAKSRLLWPV